MNLRVRQPSNTKKTSSSWQLFCALLINWLLSLGSLMDSNDKTKAGGN